MIIAPTEVFRPYDIGNNGTLAAFKLHAAFNNVNFPMMRQEAEQLVACFRDARRQEQCNYFGLLKVLDKEDVSSEEVRATLSGAPLSAGDETTAQTACGQIREKLMARHRGILTAFAGATQAGVSAAEFRPRLDKVDLVLPASQIQVLIRKYRINLTDQVDWQTFCTDVNRTKTVGW